MSPFNERHSLGAFTEKIIALWKWGGLVNCFLLRVSFREQNKHFLYYSPERRSRLLLKEDPGDQFCAEGYAAETWSVWRLQRAWQMLFVTSGSTNHIIHYPWKRKTDPQIQGWRLGQQLWREPERGLNSCFISPAGSPRRVKQHQDYYWKLQSVVPRSQVTTISLAVTAGTLQGKIRVMGTHKQTKWVAQRDAPTFRPSTVTQGANVPK